MILPKPPSFHVGFQMSMGIVGLLLEEPLISNDDIARRFEADPNSPFFITDLKIARMINSDPQGYHLSEEYQKLASLQSRNVMLCVGFGMHEKISSRFGEQSLKDMDHWKDVVDFLLANPMLTHHVDVITRIMKIIDVIEKFAGDSLLDLETIIVEYVREDPDFLFGGSEVDEELIERLLAGVSCDLSEIDLDDLISSMYGSTMEDPKNGRDERQT